jgi:hypothetical protein
MIYGPADMTQILGLGSYVGELREGPDGNLYEWVAGVDGLGNPIGFWKKAFKAVKGAAQTVVKAGLARLIPGPIKRLAKGVCNNVDRLGPVTTAVPTVLPYYAGAKGLCKVLRRTGIAGAGLMEAPDAAAGVSAIAVAIPPAARTAAKSVCGVINRLGPVLKYVPVASGYYKKAQGLCTQLRNAGIAGVSGPIMESPEGQLYEVVDTIGEGGEPRRRLRPIKLVIPAYVGPRGRPGKVQRRGRRLRPVKATAATPAPTTVHGFDEFY